MDVGQSVNRKLVIGNRTIENRLALAPMAVIGNIALRKIIAEYGGCGLQFMEMCNARAVPHENRHVSMTFKWRDEELPYLVCQLFGSDPEAFARAAVRVEKEGFFGVDVNFGCSVAAICNRNCGAALMKDPELAGRIISAIRKAVSIPVFAKFRTGWTHDPGPAVDLARRFEDMGADALVFHPRVAPDRRGRAPQWDHIRQIKQAVSIPVFGNGNVFDSSDCAKMFETTGCDGVALGRMAVVKPWIFAVMAHGFSPDQGIYERYAFDLLDHLLVDFEPHIAVKVFKKTAIYFAANFKFGHSIWAALIKGTTPDQIRDNIRRLFDSNPEISESPNRNMMV
jgi:nifR3 family TIM-barrel protein